MLLLAAAVAAIWVPSPWRWILIGVAAVVELGEIAFWLAWNRHRKATVGIETLVGRTAVVVVPCVPDGQVRLDGEIWRATCHAGAGRDQRVRIVAVDGLLLEVEPAPRQGGRPPAPA